MGYYIDGIKNSAGSSISSEIVQAMIMKKFDFSGQHPTVWVNAKQIAEILGLDPTQSTCSMIGIAVRKIGMRVKRSAHVRLILVPSYVND